MAGPIPGGGGPRALSADGWGAALSGRSWGWDPWPSRWGQVCCTGLPEPEGLPRVLSPCNGVNLPAGHSQQQDSRAFSRNAGLLGQLEGAGGKTPCLLGSCPGVIALACLSRLQDLGPSRQFWGWRANQPQPGEDFGPSWGGTGSPHPPSRAGTPDPPGGGG